MQDKNLLKMSEMATPTVMDSYTASILICYLLRRIGKPIQKEHLYDIAVGNEIINYFFYQESITNLIHQNLIQVIPDKQNVPAFQLTDRGREYARQLKEYVSKPYRNKLVSAAFRYFAKIKRENEVKLEYIPLKKGYYVHVRCLDRECDLLDLKLYAPDLTQAKFLGEQIMKNPAGFYGKILEAAFSNEEAELSKKRAMDEVKQEMITVASMMAACGFFAV